MRFTLSTSLILVLSTTAALADEDAGVPEAHFDRDEIVAASAVFRSVAERQQAALGPLERDLVRTDSSLASLDLSLALTAGAIDVARHELWDAKLTERSSRFGTEFEAIQEQLDQVGLAYEEAFEAALQRAITSRGAAIVECAAGSDDPFALSGPGGQRKAKSCPGENLSGELAAAWDADTELVAALDEIDAKEWARVTTWSEAMPVLAIGGVGPGEAWLSPADLAESIPEAVEIVDAIETRAARARQALRGARAELDPEAPEAEATLEAIRTRARGIREWGEAAKASVGAELWVSLDRSRKKAGKKGGWADVGACINPPAWGECGGRDVTRDVADVLMEDRKLVRALEGLLAELGQPSVAL